jgi:glycosyltransferase involved in cell wall biosynthesis
MTLARSANPRVALVVPGLAHAGGVPAVAGFLYQALLDSGRFSPHLISIPMSSQDPNSIRLVAPASWLSGVKITEHLWRGWDYQHVGAIGAEFEFQRYQPRQKLTTLLSEYDLVQVVAGTPAWVNVARQVQVPVCVQVATLTMVERQMAFEERTGWRRWWLKAMSRMVSQLDSTALKHVKTVFVENQWMYDHLCTQIPAHKVIFAPPGIDINQFYATKYQPNNYILCVGRLNDPRKNVPLLFNAYQQLLEMLPSAPPLILAGKSMPSVKTWQWAESLGIRDRIQIKENLSIEALADLYRQASLFALSSDEEGLGIVILEAMASGIPVVATRCGGPDTAVVHGKTGFLVPKNDATEMAQRMYDLLVNTQQAKSFGQAGKQRAVDIFSLTAASERFIKQYDKLLVGDVGENH